jgi:hypothetical protein
MQALDRLGRRAEALAVYDAGRRILADQTGLAPSPELQEAFESLLAAERGAASRLAAYEVTRAAPAGAMDTARWLAAEGETSAAIQLAIRGSWWWWFGGERSAGRDLLEELIGTHPTTELDARHALRASAWLASSRPWRRMRRLLCAGARTLCVRRPSSAGQSTSRSLRYFSLSACTSEELTTELDSSFKQVRSSSPRRRTSGGMP